MNAEIETFYKFVIENKNKADLNKEDWHKISYYIWQKYIEWEGRKKIESIKTDTYNKEKFLDKDICDIKDNLDEFWKNWDIYFNDIKKIKRRRIYKIPLSYCKKIENLDNSKTIERIEQFSQVIENQSFIINLISTKDKNYYVSIYDLSSNSEIDLNDFKKKYMNPSLFGYFDI